MEEQISQITTDNQENLLSSNAANKQSLFGFKRIRQNNLPYISRGKCNYVSVRMVETLILSQFPTNYADNIANLPPLHCEFAKLSEVNLLNEINQKCAYIFGKKLFTPKDVVVKLSDFLEFYKVIEKYQAPLSPAEVYGEKTAQSHCTHEEEVNTGLPCSQNAQFSPSNVQSDSPLSGGWIRVNNTAVPYVMRTDAHYVSLSVIRYGADLLRDVDVSGQQITPEECKFFNDKCTKAGLDFTFNATARLIPLLLLYSLCKEKPFVQLMPDADPFNFSKLPSETETSHVSTHIQSIPNVSATLPNALATLPNVPATLPNTPATLPSVPATLSNAPATLPNVPTTLPNVPATLPNMPATLPNVPVTLPNVPAIFPANNSSFHADNERFGHMPLPLGSLNATNMPCSFSPFHPSPLQDMSSGMPYLHPNTLPHQQTAQSIGPTFPQNPDMLRHFPNGPGFFSHRMQQIPRFPEAVENRPPLNQQGLHAPSNLPRFNTGHSSQPRAHNMTAPYHQKQTHKKHIPPLKQSTRDNMNLLNAGKEDNMPLQSTTRHCNSTLLSGVTTIPDPMTGTIPHSTHLSKEQAVRTKVQGATTKVQAASTKVQAASTKEITKSSTSETVEIKIELGHTASIKEKADPNDKFTHDWEVFVRGAEGNSIQHFVKMVVFYLHQNLYSKKKVVREPPYRVNEPGYGSFLLPIEIYFRHREEPKKIIINYDMFLRLNDAPPVDHIRSEKLTFQNPGESFRKKLLKAGGVITTTPENNNKRSPSSKSCQIKCIPVAGKSMSCLIKEKEAYCLLEAIKELFFPQCALQDLQFALEEVLKISAFTMDMVEEKAIIDLYTLPISHLNCNRVVNAKQFETALPRVTDMFSRQEVKLETE